MINELLMFLNQNLSELWLSVGIIYFIGFVVTMILVFASALGLGNEPKGCSSLAVSCVMIPAMLLWPILWLVVIVITLIKIKDSR